jgi:hypothetical protein
MVQDKDDVARISAVNAAASAPVLHVVSLAVSCLCVLCVSLARRMNECAPRSGRPPQGP